MMVDDPPHIPRVIAESSKYDISGHLRNFLNAVWVNSHLSISEYKGFEQEFLTLFPFSPQETQWLWNVGDERLTLFHAAILSGNIDLVRYLLKQFGPKVLILDNNGEKPLQTLIRAQLEEKLTLEIAEVCINQSPCIVNLVAERNRNTPLDTLILCCCEPAPSFRKKRTQAIYKEKFQFGAWLVQKGGKLTPAYRGEEKNLAWNSDLWHKIISPGVQQLLVVKYHFPFPLCILIQEYMCDIFVSICFEPDHKKGEYKKKINENSRYKNIWNYPREKRVFADFLLLLLECFTRARLSSWGYAFSETIWDQEIEYQTFAPLRREYEEEGRRKQKTKRT